MSCRMELCAIKIQRQFRKYQAQQRLKERTLSQIYEQLEYTSESSQKKLLAFYKKLAAFAPHMHTANTISVILQQNSLPRNDRDLLIVTNPENFHIEDDYDGPHLCHPLTEKQLHEVFDAFKNNKILHVRYVLEILHQARRVLRSLPNFNYIDTSKFGKITIVGDVHGQLKDLIYVFTQYGFPSHDNPYVFNGDFVDRGKNSIEVFLLLCLALVVFPSKVFLNRGNHEDYMVSSRYGFADECRSKYDRNADPILELCKDVFSWIPIGAICKNEPITAIILHGGISNSTDISLLSDMPRHKYISLEVSPTYGDDLVMYKQQITEFTQLCDCLWSDPVAETGCAKNRSRMIGKFFGPDVTAEFLARNHADIIIRSHQVKMRGFEFTHYNKVLTIFSASNYCGTHRNYGAVLIMRPHTEMCIKTYFAEPVTPMRHAMRVKTFEDPAYNALNEVIFKNKDMLMRTFQTADPYYTGRISLTAWTHIMCEVLQLDLPWRLIRHKFVREDENGVIYGSLLNDYKISPSSHQLERSKESFYNEKDILLTLFNLIDVNHSGFISTTEFSNICRVVWESDGITYDEKEVQEMLAYIDKDKSGNIDFNEFLESFKLVNSIQ